MQVWPFCLQRSKTFDIPHAFLQVTIAELSTLKQVQFVLAHPVERLWTMPVLPRRYNVFLSVLFSIILEYSLSESCFFCRMYVCVCL